MRLYQISEDALHELERLLPDLMDAHQSNCIGPAAEMNARQKTQWRRVQEIVVNIRWHGGPHEKLYRVEGRPPEDMKGEEWKGEP